MKYIISIVLICCNAYTYAEPEHECEAAVDAADSMNLNRKDCDYSDKGLNGVLHKAFKNGSEGAVLKTATENSIDEKMPETGGAKNLPSKSVQTKKMLSLSVEADQWSNVGLVRTQLLPKAMEQCTKGFSIIRENYRPLAMGRISLSIEFICFE
jgi:hypothetical protein